MKTAYEVGNNIDVLKKYPDGYFQMCVTSPPYWGLRDYGNDPTIWDAQPDCEHVWDETMFCGKCGAWNGCLGLEPTPELYVQHLVAIFREVKRVLRPDGVFFLNLGDCYAGKGYFKPEKAIGKGNETAPVHHTIRQPEPKDIGLKAKDLVGIPWRVAFALQGDGWWLRNEVIWHKGNPMPSPTDDRFTCSHEHIFLLTKSQHYFFDNFAVREKGVIPAGSTGAKGSVKRSSTPMVNSRPPEYMVYSGYRNKRDVWDINIAQHKSDIHFAVFPESIPEICIKAGTSEKGNCPKCGSPWERILERTKADREDREDNPNVGGFQRCPTEIDDVKFVGWQSTCKCGLDPIPAVVLDLFAGEGTTLRVARRLGRSSVGIDINPNFREVAANEVDTPDIMEMVSRMERGEAANE